MVQSNSDALSSYDYSHYTTSSNSKSSDEGETEKLMVYHSGKRAFCACSKHPVDCLVDPQDSYMALEENMTHFESSGYKQDVLGRERQAVCQAKLAMHIVLPNGIKIKFRADLREAFTVRPLQPSSFV